MGRREHMRLDHRLQPIDPHLLLRFAYCPFQRTLVGDRRDLSVGRQPGAKLVIKPFIGPVADTMHAGADRMQRTHELALIRGETRLEKDHVHVAS